MHLANCSFALFERDMFYLYFLPCGLLIDHIPSPMFKGELLTRTSPGLPRVLTHWGLGKKLPRVLQTQLTAPPDAPPQALWQSIARDSVPCPALDTSALCLVWSHFRIAVSQHTVRILNSQRLSKPDIQSGDPSHSISGNLPGGHNLGCGFIPLCVYEMVIWALLITGRDGEKVNVLTI